MRKARPSGIERLESYLVKLIQEKGADLDQPFGIRMLLAFLKFASCLFGGSSIKCSFQYGNKFAILFSYGCFHIFFMSLNEVLSNYDFMLFRRVKMLWSSIRS